MENKTTSFFQMIQEKINQYSERIKHYWKEGRKKEALREKMVMFAELHIPATAKEFPGFLVGRKEKMARKLRKLTVHSFAHKYRNEGVDSLDGAKSMALSAIKAENIRYRYRGGHRVPVLIRLS